MTPSPSAGQFAAAATDRLRHCCGLGSGQVAEPRRVREPLEVRRDLLRVAVDDADRLEDAVAALRAQLADAQRGRRRVDDGEGVGEVGAGIIGCRGVDHEGEAPGHARA